MIIKLNLQMDALKSIVDDIYEMFSDSLHTEEAKDIMVRMDIMSIKCRSILYIQ